MVGYKGYSLWGIKNSGEDITNDILDIIDNSNSFIVVGGYNFTFKTGGYTFFNNIKKKLNSGVPVLMIIPPSLSGKWSNQSQIIRYCLKHKIGLILNGNNHSKWVLTENELYYGSSNFTETSWRKRIEVVSIHTLHNLSRWKIDTINDFKRFIASEIKLINNRAKMTSIKGLVNNTIKVWQKILPLMQKFNPNTEKVILSLKNFDQLETELNSIIIDVFLLYNEVLFNEILNRNVNILNSTRDLLDYAYSNIYNEFIDDIDFDHKEIIEMYNILFSNYTTTVNESIDSLLNIYLENIEPDMEIINSNNDILNNISKLIYSSTT